MGWVQRRRDHGGVIFVDLRDREGITQVVFNPEVESGRARQGPGIRSEYRHRGSGHGGAPARRHGQPEAAHRRDRGDVTELKILNAAQTPPFLIEDDVDVSETIRLKNRHLDLRRPAAAQPDHSGTGPPQSVRQYLNGNGFLEIETPVLTRSTPEGARDYLVPSRVNPGQFYALPQIAPAVQAAADDFRLRPVLPDRALLPGRGPAGRPPAGVHPDRRGDVLCGRGRRHGHRPKA